MAKVSKQNREDISEGVKKYVNEWEKTGKIKTSRAVYKPTSKEKAIKQALAIEYGEHNIGRAGKKK